MRGGAALVGKRAVADRLLDSLVLDTTPAMERLGWNPPFTTADGLAETARWFRAGAGQG
jgi:UDP-glucose 4-epimerase